MPKLPSIKIIDIIPLLGEKLDYEVTGIRPGEKLHEVMIPEEETRNCIDMGNYYIIQPITTGGTCLHLKKLLRVKGSQWRVVLSMQAAQILSG